MNNRIMVPRASGFNPRSIAGLGLWLDASDSSSLTMNSSTVAQINDKSGNDRHFVQGTALNQPSLTTIGSKVALSLSGSQWMTGNAASLGTLRNCPGYTAIAVYGLPAVINAMRAFDFVGSTTSRFSYRVVVASANEVLLARRLDADAGESVTAPQVTGSRVGSALVDFATTTGTLRRNGAQIQAGAILTAGNSSDTDSTSVWLGRDAPGSEMMTGSIGEVLVWPRALTIAELQYVERYLGGKWGITLVPQVSNTDAQEWIGRVYANGGTVSASTADAVNTFCNAIDAAGIRDKFYRLGIFAGGNLASALVPLYRGPVYGGTTYGNATDTNTNFVGGDYVEAVGLTGDGSTKRLTCGTGISSAITAGSCHQMFYGDSLDQGAGTSAVLLGNSNAGFTNKFFLQSRGSSVPLVRFDSAAIAQGNFAMTSGMLVGTSVSNTDLRLFHDGVEQGTVVTTNRGSSAYENLDIPVFCLYGTGAQAYSASRAVGYSVGLGLTAAQVTSYRAAYLALLSGLGRTVA